MNKNNRKVLGLAAAAMLAVGVTACGDDNQSSAGGAAAPAATTSGGGKLSGKIAGAGSSAQDAAQQAWIAGFQSANSGVTISYDPVGSGGGREQFNAGATVYGGTDSVFADEELTAAQKRCGGPDNFIEIPVYISPIALIFNVDGVDKLQLSPELIASIFHGAITQWDDPAIAKENPDAKLPSERITVVHRSDDSGTTNNFTDYMAQTAPDVWTDEKSDTWPVKGQEAAEGTSGVVDAVQNGQNTIGYADASQAGDLGKVAVQVGSQGVEPSPEAAAAVVDQSATNHDPGKYQVTYAIARKTKDPSTYPIVLVSYEMACTKYSNATDAAIVKGYLNYVISSDGQAAAAQNAGSAPLSDAIRAKVQPAIDAIGS
ncbi:MAG: phosphate transport system substrate-binding protein [Solirubrobacteraceae bacterium]|jgi:phosphate transport system substrate-binding protein|nr:phosphate transport system substrate-binding protein [Solirubrobacteraceae bacterium]